MKKEKLILLLFLLSAYSVMAQEEEHPSMYGVGSYTITVLPEIQQQGNKEILIGATDDMVNRYIPEGTYRTAVNGFMIETPDKTILVDAGLNLKLLDHLETCGKKVEDIDIILLTHLHGDHIGGLLQNGEKTFPAATLYVSQPEYDYWIDSEHARKVLNAYKDNLHLFIPSETEDTEKELLPGIRSIAAYGHTPGHTTYLLSSEGDQLLIWGDLTHAMSIQIPCPQVAVTYDTDPVKAVEARQHLLEYVSKNNIRIAGMHIEYPGIGDIKGDPSKGYTFTLVCTCEGTFR